MTSVVSQLILSVKALSASGLAPIEVFQSSQFLDLLVAVDKAVENRAKVVSALGKRKREEDDEEAELELRKRKALKKIDEVEEYEVFRKQQWVQYYDWIGQQQLQNTPAVTPSAPAPSTPPSGPLADEDIDAQLLGL